MNKAKESCLSKGASSPVTAALDKFKEEKYQKLLSRTLKRGRDGAGREYMYVEEESHY